MDRKPTYEELMQRVKVLEEEATKHRRTEEALVKERHLASAILNTAGVLVVVLDREGRITRFNRACEGVMGYSAAEVLGRVVWEFLAPVEELPGAMQPWKSLRSGNFPNQHENQWVARDGSRRMISWSDTTLVNSEGKVENIVGIGIDLTERKQMERALRENEHRFRSLVETTSDWVWEVDEQGFYTYVSPKVRELLGYEPEEMIGRKPFNFMPLEEAERTGKLFKDIVKSRKSFTRLENTNLHKDGSIVVLETSGIPVFNIDGTFAGYRGIDRDITERKRVEEEREKLIRNLEDSLARIRQLHGLLPICASCKKIRDDHGYWNQLEAYIEEHSEAELTHGLCPDCMRQLYGITLDRDGNPKKD